MLTGYISCRTSTKIFNHLNGLSSAGCALADGAASGEEQFDLGPDPFQLEDIQRQAVLRDLTRRRVSLMAASGVNGSDAVFDPVLGTVMRRADLQQYEVLRSKTKHGYHDVTEADVTATMERLMRDYSTEMRLLPQGWLERRRQTGRPAQLFVVTGWRSGSTFLGHILTEHAGVFSHYEPLMWLGVHQARSMQQLDEVHHTLRELRACRYHDIPRYINATQVHTLDMLSHNPRVWRACRDGPNRHTCTNPHFLELACRMMPLYVFKLVRLRLRQMERYLAAGDTLVLFLVRDPRAMISSRANSVRWCRREPECIQPSRLCADMEEDLEALQELRLRYPDSVRMLRYEDLAREPVTQLQDVFQFTGLEWTPQLEKEVRDKTQHEESGAWGVQKMALKHIDSWKQKLSDKQISYINEKCERVIKTLQYTKQ